MCQELAELEGYPAPCRRTRAGSLAPPHRLPRPRIHELHCELAASIW